MQPISPVNAFPLNPIPNKSPPESPSLFSFSCISPPYQSSSNVNEITVQDLTDCQVVQSCTLTVLNVASSLSDEDLRDFSDFRESLDGSMARKEVKSKLAERWNVPTNEAEKRMYKIFSLAKKYNMLETEIAMYKKLCFKEPMKQSSGTHEIDELILHMECVEQRSINLDTGRSRKRKRSEDDGLKSTSENVEHLKTMYIELGKILEKDKAGTQEIKRRLQKLWNISELSVNKTITNLFLHSKEEQFAIYRHFLTEYVTRCQRPNQFGKKYYWLNIPPSKTKKLLDDKCLITNRILNLKKILKVTQSQKEVVNKLAVKWKMSDEDAEGIIEQIRQLALRGDLGKPEITCFENLPKSMPVEEELCYRDLDIYEFLRSSGRPVWEESMFDTEQAMLISDDIDLHNFF